MAAIPNNMASNMPASGTGIHNQEGQVFYVFSKIRNNGMGETGRT